MIICMLACVIHIYIAHAFLGMLEATHRYINTIRVYRCLNTIHMYIAHALLGMSKVMHRYINTNKVIPRYINTIHVYTMHTFLGISQAISFFRYNTIYLDILYI